MTPERLPRAANSSPFCDSPSRRAFSPTEMTEPPQPRPSVRHTGKTIGLQLFFPQLPVARRVSTGDNEKTADGGCPQHEDDQQRLEPERRFTLPGHLPSSHYWHG